MAQKSKRYAEIMQKIGKVGAIGKTNIIMGFCCNIQNKTSGGLPWSSNDDLFHLAHSKHDLNPVQRATDALIEGCVGLDNDGKINAYYSGTEDTTHEYAVLHHDGKVCKQEKVREELDLLLTRIRDGEEKMGKRVSFKPFIDRAIQLVTTDTEKRERMDFVVLFIFTDGNIDEEESKQALVKASHYPISIVIVGLGKGSVAHYDPKHPTDLEKGWKVMIDFDKHTKRQGVFNHSENRQVFDNVNFINFQKSIAEATKHNPAFPEMDFVADCLEEIPEQYKKIKEKLLHQK